MCEQLLPRFELLRPSQGRDRTQPHALALIRKSDRRKYLRRLGRTCNEIDGFRALRFRRTAARPFSILSRIGQFSIQPLARCRVEDRLDLVERRPFALRLRHESSQPSPAVLLTCEERFNSFRSLRIIFRRGSQPRESTNELRRISDILLYRVGMLEHVRKNRAAALACCDKHRVDLPRIGSKLGRLWQWCRREECMKANASIGVRRCECRDSLTKRIRLHSSRFGGNDGLLHDPWIRVIAELRQKRIVGHSKGRQQPYRTNACGTRVAVNGDLSERRLQ